MPRDKNKNTWSVFEISTVRLLFYSARYRYQAKTLFLIRSYNFKMPTLYKQRVLIGKQFLPIGTGQWAEY